MPHTCLLFFYQNVLSFSLLPTHILLHHFRFGVFPKPFPALTWLVFSIISAKLLPLPIFDSRKVAKCLQIISAARRVERLK